MPTKTQQKRLSALWDSFNDYHAKKWGEDRWRDSLLPALTSPQHYVALKNHFASSQAFEEIFSNASVEADDLKLVEFPSMLTNESQTSWIRCYAHRDPLGVKSRLVSPMVLKKSDGNTELLTHWNMDAASALAVQLLDVRPGHKVLDMCAAPGGKSIAIAQNVWPSLHGPTKPITARLNGCLHCNEYDQTRGQRLAANVRSYLPKDLITDGSVRLLHVDASLPSGNLLFPASGLYDRVLVDVPCSAERHVIHAYQQASSSGRLCEELEHWRSGPTNTLVKTQIALLVNASLAVRVHGVVVYATCSIQDCQNDEIVGRALARLEKLQTSQAAPSFSMTVKDLPRGIKDWAEATERGCVVLPDCGTRGSWGPLYISLLEKRPH